MNIYGRSVCRYFQNGDHFNAIGEKEEKGFLEFGDAVKLDRAWSKIK